MTTRQTMVMRIMLRIKIDAGKMRLIEQLKRERALVTVLAQSEGHVS